MPRFLLLVSPDRPPPEAVSPTRLGRRATAVLEWLDGLRQRDRVAFAALVDPKSDRVERDVRDEAARGIGAPIRLCFVIDAADRDAILGIAGSCPFAAPGAIDVLELEAWLPSQPGVDVAECRA